MPLLTYPLALLGLVTVPGLVAIYLLHRRFERREVTALFLWSSLARAEQGGRRLERFRMPLLFLIELLALVALALAAADLRYMAAHASRPLVVILDDSYSLQARVGGTIARERGLSALREEFARYQPTEVRVILAGTEPQVAASALPPSRALDLIEQRWRCLAPDGDLAAAIALASEIGEPDSAVVVLTDRAPRVELDAPRRRWLAVGRAAPNAGFVTARRSTAGEGRDRCFLQIANPGRVPVQSQLTITGDGQSLSLDRTLALPPGAAEQVSFEVPSEVDTVRAELAEDALATDNVVLLLPPRPHRVRVANMVGDAALREQVEQALTASGLRDPSLGVPGLVISDRSPGPSRPQRWTLEIRVPKEALPFTGPFVADWGHRLTQGLDFAGVVWAGQGGAEPEGQPVLMAGNTSLLEDQAVGGGHALRMYFDSARSTVPRTPNWPALFWNLLSWRAESHPGFVETQVRLGQTARLLLPPGAAEGELPVVRLEAPGAPPRELANQASDELAVAATLPGVYSAHVGDQTYRFACNALSPPEGDLAGCATVSLGADPTGSALRRDYASGAWGCGLLAYGLLLLHAFLLRPRTRSAAMTT